MQENLQAEGIFRGPVATDAPTEGYTLITQEELIEFQTIDSPNGVRFFTDLDSIGDIQSVSLNDLIQRLSLSDRYRNGAVLIKFPTAGKIIRKPTVRDSGFYKDFRYGGKAKGGANEWVTIPFPNVQYVEFEPVKTFSSIN